MKKLLVFLLLLFSYLSEFVAQGNYGSNIYMNEYLTGYSQILSPVMQKVNDTYYFMAYVNKPTPLIGINFKNALVQVDDNGIMYEYLLDSLNQARNPDFGQNIYQLNDSILLMTAYSRGISESQTPYYIRKFNLLNDTSYNYIYYNENNAVNYFREIKKFNNNIIVIGYHQKEIGNDFLDGRTQIYSYDSNLINIQSIPFVASHRGLPHSRFESSLIDNSDILISSMFYDINLLAFANQYPMRHNLWVFKLDSTYQMVNEYRDNSDGTLGACSIIKANDGGYLVFTGKRARDYYNPPPFDDMFSHTSFKGLVVKLDENLNFQWEKAYTDSADAHSCRFRDAIRTSDGNILAVGNYFGYQTPDCNHCKDMLIWLVKMNDNGEVLWQRKYRSIPGYSTWTFTETFQVLEEEDGNFRVLNQLIVNQPNDPIPVQNIHGQFMNIFRTDANGCVAPDCESVGLEDFYIKQPVIFSIYPNPASDYLALHFTEQLGRSYQITIIDMQGRVLHNKTCVNDGYDSILSLQGYTPGTYLIHIQQNGKRVGSKLFVKH
ncbi:MAG: T9SS type A sorting domain-containing protein [Flavobacteriales bacterium]